MDAFFRTKHAVWAVLTLAAAALYAAPGARAQGSRKDDVVFNGQGRPMAGATVRVCTASSTGEPCSPLALVYSDPGLTQALANPLATDGLGNYTFYAAPGRYTIEVSGPGITTKQMPNVILPSDPSSPTFTTVTTTSGISAFSLSLAGNLTVTGSAAVTGALSVAGAPVPSTGQDNQWSAAQRFKGPVPYRDITAYMPPGGCADDVNANTADYHALISINSSSTSGTITSNNATWKQGCGISISGAGPTSTIGMSGIYTGIAATRSGNVVTVTIPGGHYLPNLVYQDDNPIVVSGCADSSYDILGEEVASAPTSTTVTYANSGSNGSTTGCTVSFLTAHAQGVTGSVTYYYKVSAIDALDGVSPAVGPVSITNGSGTGGSGSTTDSFMRSNGGLGSNWTTVASFTAPTITSDVVAGNTGSTYQAAYYSGTSFAGDLSVTVTFGGTTSIDSGAQIGAMITDGTHGYFCGTYYNSGGLVYLQKFSGPSGVGGIVNGYAALAVGDTLTITQSGNGHTFTCLKNGTPISGASATDSMYTVSYPGLIVYGNTSNSKISAFSTSTSSIAGIGRNSSDGQFDFNWIGWTYTNNARMFAIWRSLDNATWTLAGCPTTVGWSDYGFNAPCPQWVPSTPPASNTAQSLKTTIASVSGSSITVNNAASNSATSAVSFHDETTFLTQCLTDLKNDQADSTTQTGGSAYCFLPASGGSSAYYFNSDMPWDSLSVNGGSHLEVAGTMYSNTWPWIFTQGGYYIHGMASNTTPTNFGTFPATQVYFGKHVPAAFVFHESASAGISHLGTGNLYGFGLEMSPDPETGASGSACFDNVYLGLNANSGTGVPLVFDGNTLGVTGCSGSLADNINLEPAETGFPASILMTNTTYYGNGQCCISLGYTQMLWHQVYVDSPGGQTEGQGSSLNISTAISEEHGLYSTGGLVTLDSGNNDGGTGCSGGPCPLPEGTNNTRVAYIGINLTNADSSNKTAFMERGYNSSYFSLNLVGDNFYTGVLCIHGATNCNSGGGIFGTPGNGKTYVTGVGRDAGVVANNYLLYTGYNVGTMPGYGGASGFSYYTGPPISLTLTDQSGMGSLSAGLHCYKIVLEDNQATPGTTVPSSEACITVNTNDAVSIGWTDQQQMAEKDVRVYKASQPCDEYQCYENAYNVYSLVTNGLNQAVSVTSESGWTSDAISNHYAPSALLWTQNCFYCYIPSHGISYTNGTGGSGSNNYQFLGPAEGGNCPTEIAVGCFKGEFDLDSDSQLKAAIRGTETTPAATCASGADYLWPDATDHRWKACNNNGTASDVALKSDFAAPPAIGSTTPASISGTTVSVSTSQGLSEPLSTPASSSATCTAGQMWADANYVYICTATNTIKRAALSTF